MNHRSSSFTYMWSSKHMEGPTTLAAPLQILNAKKLSAQGFLRPHLFLTTPGEGTGQVWWQQLWIDHPRIHFGALPSQPQHRATQRRPPGKCMWSNEWWLVT